jgi:hypothetical protein
MSTTPRQTQRSRRSGGSTTERKSMSQRTATLPTPTALIGSIIRKAQGRLIHLIDIENIAGGPYLTVEAVERAKEIYLRSGLYQLGDLVYIACSRANAFNVGVGWREGHLVCATGRDGADFELIKAIERERIPERFAQVVIASGDGIFTTRAEVLRRQGVEVTVVAPTGGLSTRLRRAASNAVLIDTEAVEMFFYSPDKDAA